MIVFLTLGIACALFYLAELIEEFTTTTKRLLTYLIRVRGRAGLLRVCHVLRQCPPGGHLPRGCAQPRLWSPARGPPFIPPSPPSIPPLPPSPSSSPAPQAELALHAALIIDRQPLLCLATGAAAQVAYHALLKRFPYNTLGQGASLAAAGLFLAATGLWARHFWVEQHSIEYMVGFCLVTTWLTPFFILLGVSGDQSSLPGAGGYPYASPAAPSTGVSPGKKQRRGLALRMFDVLRRKRDDVIPDIMSSLPGMSKEKM